MIQSIRIQLVRIGWSSQQNTSYTLSESKSGEKEHSHIDFVFGFGHDKFYSKIYNQVKIN